MFDDKIGDVYRGGRKIGEVRRRNDGFCAIIGGILLLIVLIIGGVVFGIMQIGTHIQSAQVNAIDSNATPYAAEDYADPNSLNTCYKNCLHQKAAILSFEGTTTPLKFTHVDAEKTGTYTLNIVYSSVDTISKPKETDQLLISVNNNKQILEVVIDPNLEYMSSVETTIVLNKGNNNSIVLSSTSDADIEIDRIEII